MVYTGQSITITVAQIGRLNRAETKNALGLANLIQQAYHFEMYYPRFSLSQKRFKLANSGFDLDRAVYQLIQERSLPKPFVFVTSLPYGERERGRTKEAFIFSQHRPEFDPDISIISTYLWDRLPGTRRLQPYILYNLATAVLSKYAGLQFHSDKPQCPFFSGSDPEDIDYSFDGTGLCSGCEHTLQAKLRNSEISVAKIAAAKKLFNRASGKKMCFMVMPFRRELDPVYKIVGQVLKEEGWTVVRADEIVRPRRITDAIMQAILMSDLVVADLTGSNPNVFYEVGVAHAIGCDVIMLTQERRIPFDVAIEETIFYRCNERGLRELDKKLRRKVGSGSS